MAKARFAVLRQPAAVMLALVFLFQLSVTSSWASLQSEMQGMFNTMVNVTDSNYYQGMGRGVVSGPSLVMRTNRVRTDLFDFRPPSISAGCGGIDMFLGSFSFINKDQFIHLMQAVATNAAGYAFNMALSTMCPSCEAAITKLQRAMQKMNAMAGNSCRIAQGLVNAAAKLAPSGLSQALENGPIASAANAVGTGADAFSTFLDTLDTGSNTKNMSDADIRGMLGNAAWKVLQRDGYITSAFTFGDNDLGEALMSVTGTVTGVKGSGDFPVIHFWAPTLTVKDLMDGSDPSTGVKPNKYHCLNSDCTDMETDPFDFEGLTRMVQIVLLGSNLDIGTDSFIYKLANNSGTLTEQEKQLIRVAPYHMTRLRNMAVCAGEGNLAGLPTYAKKASTLIALEIISHYLKDAMTSIMTIAQGNGVEMENGIMAADYLAPKYRAQMEKVNKQLRDQEAQIGGKATTDLEQIYQSAVKGCNLKAAHIINPFKSTNFQQQ